ncbi:hypothetical protein DL771_007519 [Monosporascus sp. 5C6A]|nr:hypothetical protein DL771_007519 [Monosporascus sp. 5C6A]
MALLLAQLATATVLALLIGGGSAAPPIASTTAAASQYCDGETGVCYSEATVGVAPIKWRVAIPAVTSGPFDILLQVVAPRTVGWAGIAWGGGMLYNPLSLGWANGNTSVSASRFAYAHVQPDIYDEAVYTTLKGTSANATHWTLTTLCKGCSQWVNNGGARTTLDPGATAARFAFAASPTPPLDPADPWSPFEIHSEHALFTLDMRAAQSPDFEKWIESLSL